MGISPTGEKLIDFEIKFGGCYSVLDRFIIYVWLCLVHFEVGPDRSGPRRSGPAKNPDRAIPSSNHLEFV